MKRPTVTREMILSAVTHLKNVDEEVMDAIADGYHHPMDGHQIAVMLSNASLDDYTLQDCLEFDIISGRIDRLLQQAEKAWAKDNDIQPPYPNGTRIKQGVIHGITEYATATYRVKEDGCTQKDRYLLIKFENAVAV